MDFVLPSPIGVRVIRIVALPILLIWLAFTAGGRHRWGQRAALNASLAAAVLAIGECAVWLAGAPR